MNQSKFISFLLLLLGVFFAGCGGGGGSDSGSDFVFTGPTSTAVGSRALTFNFVRAQEAALEVPADTTQIRFRFYSGANGTGTIVQEELRDFAPSITINPVDGATQSYVITAISGKGYPLLEVTAALAADDEDIDFSGLTPVVVTADTLTIIPASSNIDIGGTVQFQAFVQFSNGETVEPVDGDVTWDATFQASIDANGLATGNADGVSTVTATFDTLTATADIIIGQGLLLTRLEVTPDNASVALNSDIQFSVAGFDQNDNDFSLDGLTVVWSATGDASIDMDTGLATGDSLVPNTLEGMATITATIDTLDDSTDLTIIGEPGDIVGITTTPDPVSLNLDGPLADTLSSLGDFQNGPDQVLTNADNGLLYTVTGNAGVASVDMTTGEVTAIAQGSTEVTASAGTQTDVVTVNVAFGVAGNQTPVVTVDANLVGDFSTPVGAFSNATVTDPTQASFVGGTLTVTDPAAGISIITLPTIPDIGVVTNNGSNSVSVALSGNATPANLQTVLRNTTLSGISVPTQLDISVDDGQGANGSDSKGFVPEAVVLTNASNTFDTTTGLFNGIPTPWTAGAIVQLASFDLQAGATLTVTGSNPFLLDTTGNILVGGTIDASGGDAADSVGLNQPGTAGGSAGPGGFPGGQGGGSGLGTPSGQDGFGPGSGGAGTNTQVSELNHSAGGGGAGHLFAGTAGIGLNGAVAGAGGPGYPSIPQSLLGGSGGGGGSAEADGGGTADDGAPGGGGGGGVVRLLALGTLTVSNTGVLNCSGGKGGGATPSSNGGEAGSGGGGSGGSIVLLSTVAPTVQGLLDVAGGSGGTSAFSGANGGNGSVGRTSSSTI